MSADSIATALGGRRVGGGWMARCPAHDDCDPSLSIKDRDDRTLVHCHAGCEQREVIAALNSLGLWAEQHRPATVAAGHVAMQTADRERRRKQALAIWESAHAAGGSLVERYLLSRGLEITPPERLRFHPGLKHPTRGSWPAMVALVTDGITDVPIGIQRTFLARDGNGKAPVSPQKMMLGSCRSGAVRLAPLGDPLMIGEGIESCLAAFQATGQPAWAALSTSGLRALDLPALREVIVLADGDTPGEEAAGACARRWRNEGRVVRIARPPRGFDFNDLLRASVADRETGA